jgi:uncharacterized membrane protein YbaN (DUF454 family)
MTSWKKLLFFFLGLTFLVLAYIGIILPGIPGIPFILLAGWFFLKSSDKLYKWMYRQKILGKVLNKFNKENVTEKAKWFVISQYWVSIIVAQIIFTLSVPLIIGLNCLGIIGSIVIYKLLSNGKK